MTKATDKMKAFAEKIAKLLGVDEPDYNDFNDTADFIDENKDEYYNTLDGRD